MIRLLDMLVGWVSVALFAISTGLVCINVFYRYAVLGLFRKSAQAYDWLSPVYRAVDGALAPITATADEMPGLLLVWIAFLGAYLALRSSSHIGFDMLVEKLPLKLQRLIRASICVMVMGFLAIVTFESIRMIRTSGATEIETAEIAQGWFMLILPIAASLMFIAAVIQLLDLYQQKKESV